MDKYTPQGKGVRTAIQTIVASFVGLAMAVWNVPGVPETVAAYAQDQALQLFMFFAAFIGLPAGLLAYFQNRAGK